MRIGIPVVCQNGHASVWVLEIDGLDARNVGATEDCACPKFALGDGWRPSGEPPFIMDVFIGYCRPCGTARKTEPCRKCGGALKPLLPDHDEPRLPDIERIRALAREVGYAIGVHGTLERDLDLIAVPWAKEAVMPPELAAHLAKGLNAHILNDKVQDKPLGRWSCSIQIDGWFKVIDLSVAPGVRPAPSASERGALGFGYGECGDCLPDGSCTMNCTSAVVGKAGQ